MEFVGSASQEEHAAVLLGVARPAEGWWGRAREQVAEGGVFGGKAAQR